MQRNPVKLAAVASVMFALASPAFANSIGINFLGGGPNGTGTVTGSAGVSPAPNWNNVANNTGSGIALIDSTGGASGASISTFTSTNTYAIGVADDGASSSLMKGYLDNTNAGTPTSVTVTNIPYSNYLVVGYVGSDGSGRTGSIALGANTFVYSTLNNYPSNGFVLTTTPSGTAPGADYAVFKNQTASSFTVTNTRNSNNVGLHGLQIYDTSNLSGTGFGVNFIGGRNAGDATGSVGVNAGAGQYAQFNWNNAAPRDTNTGTLVAGTVIDRQGNALASTTVSWSTTNTWSATTAGPADDNHALMKGYLDDSANGSTVTVNSVGLRQYDVVVYMEGDQNAGGVDGQYWLEDTSGNVISDKANVREGTNGTNSFSGVFKGHQATAGGTSLAKTGNYIVFHGVTSTDFVLRADNAAGGRAPLNGFQVFETNRQSIGVNFVGGGGSAVTEMSGGEIAGVFGQSQWNQVADNGAGTQTGNQSGSATNLKDGFGDDSGASITWSAPNTYNVSNGSTAGDYRLLAGYLDNHPTITMSDITYGKYDVYVYMDADSSRTGQQDTYTLNGTLNQIHTEGVFDGVLTEGRDYVVFHNISGDSFTLTSATITSFGAGEVSGIQIVAVPAPAALPAGLALLAAAGLRRGRRDHR